MKAMNGRDGMRWWDKFKKRIRDFKKRQSLQNSVTTEFGNVEPASRYPLEYKTKTGGGIYLDVTGLKSISMTGTNSDGITALSMAIRGGHLNQVEKISLTCCDTTDEAIVVLMNAIMSATHKQIATIDFSSSKIGDEAAIAISKAIESGCFTDQSAINLYDSNISDVGAAAIAKALTHPNCPRSLWVRLEDNFITHNGAEEFRQIFQNLQCKRDIRLHFSNFKDKSMYDFTKKLRQFNEYYPRRYDVLSCLTFYLGLTDLSSPVSVLNRNIDVMTLICAYLYSDVTITKENKPQHVSVTNFQQYKHPSLLFAQSVHQFYKERMRGNDNRPMRAVNGGIERCRYF